MSNEYAIDQLMRAVGHLREGQPAALALDAICRALDNIPGGDAAAEMLRDPPTGNPYHYRDSGDNSFYQ